MQKLKVVKPVGFTIVLTKLIPALSHGVRFMNDVHIVIIVGIHY